ncbi:MAG: transglutaminase domain-containing protein [Firmicutes bacterium]|nr:transglutaminase domain-containing protein [Bacillota bacterium]
MDFFKKRQEQNTSMDLYQLSRDDYDIHPGRLIFELLLTVALSLGCWYSFFTMFPNPVNFAISLILIVLIPPALLLLMRIDFLAKYLVFYVFTITAVMFLVFYKKVWNGFLVMVNIILKVIDQETGAGIVLYKITGSVHEWQTDTLLASIPVMLLVGLGIAHSVYHKEAGLGFVLTIIPVAAGLMLKGSPSIPLFILLMVAWTSLFAISAVAHPDTGKRDKIFIQRRNYSALPYIFAGVTLVLLTAFVLVFSGQDFTPPKTIDDAKAKVLSEISHLRYDPLGGVDTDELSEGDLTQVHSLAYTDAVVIKLRENIAVPMHLRGFTGGYFDGEKWQASKDGAYAGSYLGITEWLAQHDFYPLLQQDKVYRMFSDYDLANIDVENVGASSKYIYMPYEAVKTGDAASAKVDYIKDYGAFAKGIRGDREYSIKSFIPRASDYSQAETDKWIKEISQNENWSQYEECEEIYRSFVYDTYLDVPEALYLDGLPDMSGKHEQYVLDEIRKYLSDNFVYDTETGKAPGGQDELEYFAYESHTGNDMHFATLATLLFRQAGIPARYVEGYYISPEDIALYEDTSDVTISVLDSNAHAWTEIYVDKLGWTPVEIIPGFYNLETQISEETEEDKDIREDDSMIYEDDVPLFEDNEEDAGDDKNMIPVWIWIVLAIIILIALYELAGKKYAKARSRKFRNEINDQMAVKIYDYLRWILKFDGLKIADNPYDNMAELSEILDGHSDITYSEFISYLNRMRFGKISLDAEEQRRLADFAEMAGVVIYARSGAFKRFVMKYILFTV